MVYSLERYVRTVITSTAHRLTKRLHPEHGHYQPATKPANKFPKAAAMNHTPII